MRGFKTFHLLSVDQQLVQIRMMLSMYLFFLVVYVVCLGVQASWLTDSEYRETRVISVNGRENSSYLSKIKKQEMIYNNNNNSRRQHIRNA